MTSLPAPASGSAPAPAPAPDGVKRLADRLNRWEADGTLERALALIEGAVGVSDATTEHMVASAGASLINTLALLETINQDERARQGLTFLVERLGEWKETGALETLVTLAEGLVGVSQATTDSMVAEAGGSFIGAIRFLQGLPPWHEVEPLVKSFQENAGALQALLGTLAVFRETQRLQQEVAAIPPITGLWSLGRTLRDPEVQQGLKVALVLLKQLGKAPNAVASPPG